MKILLSNVLFLFCFFSFSCTALKKSTATKDTNLTDLKFRVEPANDWTALLKRSSGWLGGDGIYTIPMDGKENAAPSDSSNHLVLFSDSMLGELEDGKQKSWKDMLHNTVAILDGKEPLKEQVHFYWDKDEQGKAKTVFIPSTPLSTPDEYFWLGDGFVNQSLKNTTYIFGYKMKNLDAKDDWSFTQTGTVLIAIPAGTKPPFKNQRQIETPLSFHGNTPNDNGTFGAGIFANTTTAGVKNADGYIYVYGTKGKATNLIAARVKPKEFENFSKWTFWDGKGWTSQMQNVGFIVNGVSNELSVSPLNDGRYLLVFQMGGMSSTVAMRIGASPVGPFGPIIKLYDCPESKENKNYFMYNAKAHPSLSKPGELLISYNVNSFEFWKEIQTKPTLYRPRFLKLIF